MGSPDERAFVVFVRGHVRDNIILASFRNDLRTLVNPTTGIAFTEDEIQRATAPGTRFYIEADAIDLFGQASQQRAVFFASQIDPRSANDDYLDQFHGALWLGDDSRLPATGASGPTRASGTNGTIIPGSVIVPDPAAAIATDPNGKRYQNLNNAVITNGVALLTLQGIDTGFVTRLAANTELRWSANVNPGTDPVATVVDPFDGGFDAETSEEYAARIVQRMRDRPAAGNAAHFQAWAGEASSAVEQAFVYSTGLNSGSVVVAVTEKRPTALAELIPEGPNARIPSAGTLNTVAQYIVPPASPVVPERVFVMPVGAQPQQSDLTLRISMALGRSGGWADASPWPSFSSIFPALALDYVSGDGLTIRVTTDRGLPSDAATLTGTNASKIMIFNREISRWVLLDVASITDPAPGFNGTRPITIVLNTEPVMYDAAGAPRVTPVLAIGDHLSPYTSRADAIATALEAYFDTLGPGEIIDSSDVRFSRVARRPPPSIAYPQRAGQAAIRYVLAGLGGVAADAELTIISRSTPDLPTNIADGPNMLTLGHTNIFPL